MLFAPGDRLDRFGKALSCGADAVCLDLEDGVAPANKALARKQIRIFLGMPNPGAATRAVRVNALDTRGGLEDLLAIAASPTPPDAVLLPKVETAAICAVAVGALGGATALVALLESVAGLREADAIAAAPGVARLMFGSADYAGQVGCAMSPEALAYPRAQVTQAAAGAGIDAMDGAWLALDDLTGLAADCALARAMGFTGKPALHPAQVETIRAAFTPSDAALARAAGVVAAFQAARGGVAVFEGRMLDAPVVRQAERILALAGRSQTSSTAAPVSSEDAS